MEKSKFISPWRILFFSLMVLLLWGTAQVYGPDRELSFSREVTSELSPDRIERNLSAVTRWPQWFYSLSEVQAEEPVVKEGALLTLKVDPQKGPWKKFDVKAQVTHYVPGKTLSLKILEDSSGRLNRLFSSLEWKIELKPLPQGTLIRGTAVAQTRNWRSRLFGKAAERILMNQVFYPNVLKLSELRQPFSVDQGPATDRPLM